MPSGNIPGITEDSKGFIWIETFDGVVRYDGHSFQTIRGKANGGLELPSNIAETIVEGPGYKIWVVTRTGLSIIDPVYMRVVSNPSQFQGTNLSLLKKAGNFMLAELDGVLYLLNEYGETVSKRNISDNRAFIFADITKGVAFKNDQVVFYKISPDTSLSVSITDTFYVPFETAGDYSYFYDDSTFGGVTKEGVLFFERFYLKRNERKRFILGNGFDKEHSRGTLFELPVENDGSFWFFKQFSLLFMQKNSEEEFAFKTVFINSPDDTPNGLLANNMNGMYLDRDGRLWLGDNGRGLSMLDTRQMVFKDMNLRNLGASGIARELLWHIVQSEDDKIFLSGDHGVVELQLSNPENLYSDVFLKTKVISRQQYPTSEKKENLMTVNAFSKNEVSYFNIYRDGIYKRIDGKEEKLFPDSDATFQMTRITAHKILNDSLVIWGTYNHVLVHNLNNDLFEILPFPKDSTKKNRVMLSLAAHQKKNKDWVFWVGSGDGVLEINYPRGEGTYLTHDSTGVIPLKGKDIMAIDHNADSSLWLATYTHGVVHKNLKTGAVRYFDEENGLANQQVAGLVRDYKGRIWVAQNLGVSYIEPRSGEVFNFGRQHGTRMSEFNQNAYSTNGELIFFGGMEGGIVFHPDSVSKTFSENEKLVFTGLKFNRIGKDTPENKYLIDENILSVSYRDNSFEIGFSDLNYTNKDRSYSYRFKGEGDWQEVPKELSKILVSNLGVGRHKLEIRSRNASGNWKKASLNLAIHVEPPFWLTTWFLTTLTFFAVSGIGFITYKVSGIYYNKRISRLENEKRVQTERERLSRDLHDSIGSQLSIILRHLEHVESSEVEESKIRLKAANNAAHYTIRQLRESLWALKKDKIKLTNFVDRIKELITRSLEGTNIQFEEDIQIRKDFTIEPIEMLHLLRIVHESVNNALKYSEAKTIKLKVDSDLFGRWKLCVSDNGKGFDLSKMSREDAYGLMHIKTRAEEIQAEANIKAKPGDGVEICIKMGGY